VLNRLPKGIPKGIDAVCVHSPTIIGNMNRLFLLAVALSVMLTVPAGAQTTYSLAEGSTLEVDGTSNQSDWSVSANEFTGSFELGDGVPVSASVTIVVKEIKSGRSMIMDRLMHNSFNVDEYPEMIFSLDSAEKDEDGEWNMSGSLEMVGTSNPVIIHMIESESEIGTPQFTGSYDLKMSDFGMKPPTAMFGSLHTKDDVVISFNFILQQ